MSVETMHQISRFCYGLAILLGCVVVILFFRFHIWKAIGDFTGANKKRELKAICAKEQTLRENKYEMFVGSENNHVRTEKIFFEEQTGLLEDEREGCNIILVKELGFLESQDWIT